MRVRVDFGVCVVRPYLMFALHPAHSNIVFVGFPCPFLPEGQATVSVCVYMCIISTASGCL